MIQLLIMALVLWFAGYSLWQFHNYGSEMFVRRKIEMFDDFKDRDVFEDSSFFGLFGIKITFSAAQREPAETKREEFDVPSVPVEVEAKGSEEKGASVRYLDVVIPRFPKSRFRMIKDLDIEFLGRIGHYELTVVLAPSSGYFRFSPSNEDEEVKSPDGDATKSKWKKRRKPLHFWQFVVKGEQVGAVFPHRLSREKSGDKCLAPDSGHITGFQILNGTKVEKGDVVMILASTRKTAKIS